MGVAARDAASDCEGGEGVGALVIVVRADAGQVRDAARPPLVRSGWAGLAVRGKRGGEGGRGCGRGGERESLFLGKRSRIAW